MAKQSYLSDDDNTKLKFSKVSLATKTDECQAESDVPSDKRKSQGTAETSPAAPSKYIDVKPTAFQARSADEPSFLLDSVPDAPRKCKARPLGISADSEPESTRPAAQTSSQNLFGTEPPPLKCQAKSGPPPDPEILLRRPAESSTSIVTKQKAAKTCQSNPLALTSNTEQPTKQVALEPTLLLQNPEELFDKDEVQRRRRGEFSAGLDAAGFQRPSTRAQCSKEELQGHNTVTLSSSYYNFNSIVLKETKELCQYIDLPTLLPLLVSGQLLTGDEFTCLLSRWEQGSKKVTIGILLEILQRKHPNWGFLLLECLRDEEEHKGHAYLVSLLEKAAQSQVGAALTRSEECDISKICSCCLAHRKEIQELRRENKKLRSLASLARSSLETQV